MKGIGKILEKRRSKGEPRAFVVPGDFSVVYDIGEGKFFAHDNKKFCKTSELEVIAVQEPKESRFYSKGVKRTYLFNKNDSIREADYIVKQYHVDIEYHGQPYWH